MEMSKVKNKLTLDVYGMVHNQQDFHQTDVYDQYKQLKMIVRALHEKTNIRKCHHVLAAQLYSIAVPINNTLKRKVKRKTFFFSSFIIFKEPSDYQELNPKCEIFLFYAYLLLNISFWIYWCFWIQRWWHSSMFPTHIFIFRVIATWRYITMLNKNKNKKTETSNQ